MKAGQTRRQFLHATAAGAAAMAVSSQATGQTRAKSTKAKFQLGMASYTLREFKLDDTLAMTKEVGLKNIAFKSFHLAMDSTPEQIAEVAAKTKKAGLNLYGGGVIYMKNKQEVDRAFEYAKAAGMKVIIGVPSPELLPMVDKKVKEYDIVVAIHNHGPGDKVYPLPSTIYDKVKAFDKRIGICIDIGHTQRMGVDPSEALKKYKDRILDVHIKDVSQATAKGGTIQIGRGVIDIPKFMATLVSIGYAGMVSFEYEKDGKKPMAGLAESVGYVHGVMDTLGIA